MYNNLFSIGPFQVHTYGLMIAIGIIAAYMTAEHRAKKKGLDPEQIFGLVGMCVIFGFAGSKLLYLITIWKSIVKDPSIIAESMASGWVVYGGILGGIIGAVIFCKIKKLPAWEYFDLALPSVALAQGFGRIGCFFAGCCYGVETESHFSITFKHSEFAPNHVHLVPTQLLSSAFDFALFFFLCFYDKRGKKQAGEVTGLYLICYSIGRFIIEFFRGDLERGSVGILSTSQFISIFTFAAGLILLIVRRKSAERTKSEAGEE